MSAKLPPHSEPRRGAQMLQQLLPLPGGAAGIGHRWPPRAPRWRCAPRHRHRRPPAAATPPGCRTSGGGPACRLCRARERARAQGWAVSSRAAACMLQAAHIVHKRLMQARSKAVAAAEVSHQPRGPPLLLGNHAISTHRSSGTASEHSSAKDRGAAVRTGQLGAAILAAPAAVPRRAWGTNWGN